MHKNLHSWDFLSTELRLSNQREIHKKDLLHLSEMAQEYNWSLDLDTVAVKSFDALVVTDANQIIEWVSSGFEKMTGYTSDFALGRRPNFLQGPATSEVNKARLRKYIQEEKGTHTTLINYRKEGDPYKCQISILPIRNKSRQTTHFLAIEKEIRDFKGKNR